jgi:hypothetical protein
LAPVGSHTDWERFRSLASDLISPRIQTDTADNADRAACNFASIASAYRLLTRKVTLSELNNTLPELDRLLQLKRRLRKFWHETKDPACKMAVNWVTKTIRRMTRRKALERWETKISNCEVIPQATWPTENSLMKRDGPMAPTVIHGLSSFKFLPVEKANATAVWKIGSHHTTCVTEAMKSRWRLMTKLCSKLRTIPPQKVRPCDVQKIICSLKLG